MEFLSTRRSVYLAKLPSPSWDTNRFLWHTVVDREYILFTDLQPFTRALITNTDRHSTLELRYLDYVSQYITDILHVRGSENVVADRPSCPSLNSLNSTVSYEELALSQDRIQNASTTSSPNLKYANCSATTPPPTR